MTVVYSEEAKATLFSISDFIDNLNTAEAGDRWVAKFDLWLNQYAKSKVTYALCTNKELADLGLSCINFNDWVIAFMIENDTFIIHKIIRGSFLP